MIVSGIHRSHFLFVSFLFFGSFSFSQDSLLFQGFKKHYYANCACELKPQLFTVVAPASSAFQYVYVSRQSKVSNAHKEAFYYCEQDTSKARRICDEERSKGNSAFIYATFGTSDALLTQRLLSYPSLSKAFVVFHELTHNYFIERKIKIDYLLNEAACDVLAVQFTKQLAETKRFGINFEEHSKMRQSLESIYTSILKAKERIDLDSTQCIRYCNESQQEIESALTGADSFFLDRFHYPVNTAFLLKNLNYCSYYFELTELYEKKGNFASFMKALQHYQPKKQG